MKKIQFLLVAAMVSSLFLLFTSCGADKNGTEANTSGENESQTKDSALKIKLSEPKDGAESLPILNETEREFILNGFDGNFSKFNKLKGDHFAPADIVFRWECDTANCIFHISDDPDFRNEKTYPADGGEYVVNWLLGDRKYYWKVSADGVESEIFSFTTEDSPRSVLIDGVINTRDLGGWKTLDGKRIKEGVLYRSQWLNMISEKGRKFCAEELGIRTELDLRSLGDQGAKEGCMLGDSVKYTRISSPAYKEFLDKKNFRMAKKILLEFCEPDNYPIIFHCVAGRDRTGSLAFLLLTLCGVPEEEAVKDYVRIVFSEGYRADPNLANIYKDNFLPYVKALEEYGDGTLNENVEKLVRDIGLSEEQISAIRDNLTEG